MSVSNETKVGALAAIAITTLILGYSFLKGNQVFQTDRVYYAVYDKVQGLSSSNHVQINGLKVGRVKYMDLMTEKGGRVVVAFNVKKEKVKVPRDTEAEIVSSDLLGEKAIRLNLGDSKELAKSGDTLKTAIQPDLTESVRQEVLPVKLKAERLLSSLDSVATIVHYMLDKKTRQSIRTSLSNIQRAMNNITRTSYALDTFVQEETKKLEKIFANVESITTNFKENNEKITALMNNLEAVSDSVKRANIKSTIGEAKAALERFSQTMDKVNRGEGSLGKLAHDEELYNNLNTSAESLNDLIEDLERNPDRYVNFSIINLGSNKKKEKDE